MGGGSGMFGSKKGAESNTSSTTTRMNKKQSGIFSDLLDTYGKTVGQKNVYQGERVAPLSIAQQGAFDFANNGGFITSPEKTREYYQNSIFQPTLKNFNEVLAPAIREEYAGPGYWGNARAGAVGKAATDQMDKLNTAWNDLAWNTEQSNKQGALTQGQVGANEQAYNQSVISAKMQKFAEENQITDPTNLAILMQLLGLTEKTTTSGSSSTTTPSWKTGDWLDFGIKVAAGL
jgi:hypothetical protein